LEYARGGSQSKIQRFWGGNKFVDWEDWDLVIGLKVEEKIQISSNALEAVRVSIGNMANKKIGRMNYRLRIRPKPWQKFRENRMLAFAGADRVQSGMRNSFGRPSGVCARVRAGMILAEVGLKMQHLPFFKNRFRIAKMKVPSTCQVVVVKYNTLENLKQAGLPLYDPEKRKEIDFYQVMPE
jgi:large subunit ribosomal protein L10e